MENLEFGNMKAYLDPGVLLYNKNGGTHHTFKDLKSSYGQCSAANQNAGFALVH